MKIHYTNILLFPLKLNILVNTHKKPSITACHTQKIPTTRSLSECELYAPVNYYSDPQMKEVMDNFNKQTQQRFHEYDERMKTTRQKCKDQCDKEIQKIILKDKLEKQMAQQFSTLHTDIQSDGIPTCVCEKSVADKVEKTCLKCGGLLGGGVAPSLGLLGEIGGLVINNWKNTPFFKAFVAFAQKKGIAAGAKAGDAAGVDKVIELVNSRFGVSTLADNALGSIFNAKNYADEALITQSVYSEFEATCLTSASENDSLLCFYGSKSGFVPGTSVSARDVIGTTVKEIVKKSTNAATQAADTAATETTNGLIEAEISKITSAGANLYTAIVYSVTAILIIVLVMVIIYLILSYRRKKKLRKNYNI
ncbi:hypothetical protein PFAG_06078 [Plasmodium falciparum Santa Lucia]|uniref:Surface antigen n=1 Tax=Plasmodium falciparum Santa Lucia TaxID=478859 RepID=W7FFS1_PLAFA|nr:hypothetical protein PFAG_06078 [Plasmodium falciparum Santa Lucia]